MISDNIEQIEKLIHMVSNSEIGELSIKEGELEIVIRKRTEYHQNRKEMPPMPPMPLIPPTCTMYPIGIPYPTGYDIRWQQPILQNNSMPNAEMQRVVNISNTTAENTKDTKSVVKGNQIKSPLVGTFYAASSPDAEPFVKKGDTVKKGQILGVIEAMKLMNEIECEYDGIVADILVKNEEMVEYGQPLFIIQ